MTRIFGNAIGKQGQRSYNRLRLGVPAVLVLPHEQRQCVIDDVSVSGARVRSDGPIRSDLSAELRFDRHRLFCTVSWSRGNQAGLRFADQLDQGDMQRLLWIVDNREQWELQRLTIGARSWTAGGGPT